MPAQANAEAARYTGRQVDRTRTRRPSPSSAALQTRRMANRKDQKMNQNNPNQQQINVELGEKEAEGIYSNLALISHSPAEFVIDFTRVLPGVPKTKVYARIIMTPQHAKSLLKAMEDNVSKYEKQFGEIKMHSVGSNQQNPIGFGAQQSSNPQTKN
jgi:hypothetical protein